MRGYGEAKPDLMIKIGFMPPGLSKRKRARKYGEEPPSEEDEEKIEAGMAAAKKRLTKKYGRK